jgi:WD40 repeat protein
VLAKGTATDVAFSSDAALLAATMLDTTRVWNMRTRRLVATLRGPGAEAVRVNFNPAGTMLVTASTDGVARVWSLSRHKLLHALVGHQGPVNDAVFGGDGREVLTVGNDGTTRVYDTATGTQQAVMRMHGNSVNAVDVAPGRILTASNDGTARIYRCLACVPLATLERRAHDYLHAVGLEDVSVKAATP